MYTCSAVYLPWQHLRGVGVQGAVWQAIYSSS